MLESCHKQTALRTHTLEEEQEKWEDLHAIHKMGLDGLSFS
jgi:hypothetical protein